MPADAQNDFGLLGLDDVTDHAAANPFLLNIATLRSLCSWLHG